MSKRSTDLERLAHRYGYRLKRSRKHLVWEHTITRFVVTTSASASDKHALNQAERLFRRVEQASEKTLAAHGF
jgi:CBS-domain-containing membrane protein